VQETPLRGDKKKGKEKMKRGKRKREREKRETEIKIRLSVKEREEIRELAREEGLNVSEYIRKRALQRQAEEQAKREMEHQIYRIGINVNQIARALNSLNNKKILKDEDKKTLNALKSGIVEKVFKELEGVLENVYQCRTGQK
jgi:predicted DNA binding CopG/RHH family protein